MFFFYTGITAIVLKDILGQLLQKNKKKLSPYAWGAGGGCLENTLKRKLDLEHLDH